MQGFESSFIFEKQPLAKKEKQQKETIKGSRLRPLLSSVSFPPYEETKFQLKSHKFNTKEQTLIEMFDHFAVLSIMLSILV